MFAVLRDRAICRMVKGWRIRDNSPTQFNGRNRGNMSPISTCRTEPGPSVIGTRQGQTPRLRGVWRLHRTISPATPPHSAGTADKAFNRQYIRSTHAARAATPSVSALMNYLPR